MCGVKLEETMKIVGILSFFHFWQMNASDLQTYIYHFPTCLLGFKRRVLMKNGQGVM